MGSKNKTLKNRKKRGGAKKCCKKTIGKLFSTVEFSQDNQTFVSRSDMLRLAQSDPLIANAIDWVKIKPILKDESLLTLPKMPILPTKFPLSIPKRPQLPLHLSDKAMDEITSKFENEEKKTAFKEIFQFENKIIDIDITQNINRRDNIIILYNNGAIRFSERRLYQLPKEKFVTIACKEFCNMAIDVNGTVIAWGLDGLFKDRYRDNFVAIAVGESYGIGLRQDGTVVFLGDKLDNRASHNTPTSSDFVAIKCGGKHNVGLKQSGEIVTWGQKNNDERKNMPTQDGFVAIACGFLHSVALHKDGWVVTWGDSIKGEYNDQPTGEENKNFVAIDCGAVHNVALKNDGTVVTWGGNYQRQRNNAPIDDENRNFVAISCGHLHSMALRNDGTIAIWGPGKKINVEGNNYIKIKCGRKTAVALKKDGTYDQWELNKY